MNRDALFLDQDDADFQRWYVGGSPPEVDSWSKQSFEEALSGLPGTQTSLYTCREAATRTEVPRGEHRHHGAQLEFAAA